MIREDDEHRAAYKAVAAKRVAIGAIVVLLVSAMCVVTYGVVVIRDSQVTNTVRNKSSAKTLDKINDCTTPGRKCFDDAQRRSATVVEALNQGSAAAAAAAAACADRPGVEGYRAIKRCVDQTLADQRP